jgi:hypothetical protein
MGYYVNIVSSTMRIPQANLQRVYDKMCALNITHHDQKNGGSWDAGQQTGKWFSWMDANYPETCPDARSILNALGFETQYDTAGDLLVTGYDSKMGQEDLFLSSIENDAIGKIIWCGEDDERWTTKFFGDCVIG